MGEQVERHPRGLAGPGRSFEDDDARPRQRGPDIGQDRVDRERLDLG
ncbi:MAG: hypothetical protein WD010_01430 [Nitriliruptor sp.]